MKSLLPVCFIYGLFLFQFYFLSVFIYNIFCLYASFVKGCVCMNRKFHLNKELRSIIEQKLDEGLNFSQIARIVHKDRRTISREVLKHSFIKVSSNRMTFNKNRCINRLNCNKFGCSSKLSCYVEESCPLIDKPPYVCNNCKKKAFCQLNKRYYRAKIAQDDYETTLSNSRVGINLSKDRVYEINSLLNSLIINNHQSLNHIFINNKHILNFSKKSLYNYINLGVFDVKNIDLQRKVKYKPRKKNEKNRTKLNIAIRNNRTYQDFISFISNNPDSSIVEMDTVEGIKGGKCLLTLLFRKTKLMLIFLLDKKNMECVSQVFYFIKDLLGIELYKTLFQVVLTDNGSEFFYPSAIELDNSKENIISHLFYCDPGKSYQKGSIEKNHEFIRYILPKGTSFDNLTQEKCNLIMNNINNTKRESLNNNSPLDLSLLLFPNEFFDKFNLIKIEDNNVNLSPNLIK